MLLLEWNGKRDLFSMLRELALKYPINMVALPRFNVAVREHAHNVAAFLDNYPIQGAGVDLLTQITRMTMLKSRTQREVCKSPYFMAPYGALMEKPMLTREQVLNSVQDACVKYLHVERTQVLESSHLVKDLGADSLDVVEMTTAFEDKYKFTWEMLQPHADYTVGEVVDTILSNVKQRS